MNEALDPLPRPLCACAECNASTSSATLPTTHARGLALDVRPATAPLVPASSLARPSHHALWFLDLSRQRLTSLTQRHSSSAARLLPGALGLLNLAHNRLGVSEIQRALAGVDAVLHLVVTGNPACVGLGLENPVSQRLRVPLSTPAPATAALAPADARAVLVCVLPQVWCLDFAFITAAEDRAARETVRARMPATALVVFASHALVTTREERDRALRLATEDASWSKWGRTLLRHVPKAAALAPSGGGNGLGAAMWWQLHTLARDWDADIGHRSTVHGGGADEDAVPLDALGRWAPQLMDNPRAAVVLIMAALLLVDPRFPHCLVHPSLPTLWAVLGNGPRRVELPSADVVVALPPLNVLKLATVILGAMELEQVKTSVYDPTLLASLRRHLAYLSWSVPTPPPPNPPLAAPAPSRRVTLELIMTCASATADWAVLEHRPWLAYLAAHPRTPSLESAPPEARVPNAAVAADRLTDPKTALAAVEARFALASTVEEAMVREEVSI
ncbi:hypothetical protein H9P43_009924 [Blastocladiella emersonii ATCC 22665]|nr:hypothetical protein H9P43_009924 [Blastocladiella emersonii ATCC 22665]